MKTIKDRITIKPYTAKTFDMYFHGKSFAVFDIETTGLNPSYCKVILSGILLANGGDAQIIQFFADRSDDEKEIIEKTIEILNTVDYVVTYNGKHFDLPFMEKRAKKHGLSFDICPYNLDLYLVINGHSCLKEVLPNLKQKTVEIYMGLADDRDDEISGGQSVALYERYMQSKSLELERRILLHNHDDLIQLCRLLPVISMVDFHSAMFKMGFLADTALIEKITMNGRDFHLLGRQIGGKAVDYISFPTEEQPYSLIMDSAGGQLELIIPCQAQSGNIFFDAQAILGENTAEIEKYPSVVNGYLIASENGKLNHLEINAFVLSFFSHLREIVN